MRGGGLRCSDLEALLGAFVEQYNHQRYHESLNILAPADVYFGSGQNIQLERKRIKRKAIEHRRLQHRKTTAKNHQSDEPELPLFRPAICLNSSDDGH